MNRETPLFEVAAHLPPELATKLMGMPMEVQGKAMGFIRACIVTMEEEGADLDPVSYRAVVYAMGVLAILAAQSHTTLAEITTIVDRYEGRHDDSGH
jgi:hypothetical protein